MSGNNRLDRFPGGILETLSADLSALASIFATTWEAQASAALWNAEVPEDPAEREEYLDALRGNMVWAFAGLHPALRPLAGSQRSRQSGTAAVAERFPHMAEEIAARGRDIAADVALADLEAARRELWSRMFPTARYGSQDLSRAIAEQLAVRLGRFRKQRAAWNKRFQRALARRASETRRRNPSIPFIERIERERLGREMPFRPDLEVL